MILVLLRMLTRSKEGGDDDSDELRETWSAIGEKMRFWPCVDGPGPGTLTPRGPPNVDEAVLALVDAYMSRGCHDSGPL